MANKRILVAVPTYGLNDSRFTTTSFMLAKFPGTELMQVRRSMPDVARNGLAEQLLKMKQDYIFFLDDDMAIEDMHPAKLLDQLVQTMDKNPDIGILAPRAYKRTKPFFPCVFHKKTDATYKPVDSVKNGLIDVDAIHCAATIVRPSVFEKMARPWFEFLQVGEVRLGEDISFTRKAKHLGIRVVCDTDLQVQHISDPVLVDHDTFAGYNYIEDAVAKEAEKAQKPAPVIVRP